MWYRLLYGTISFLCFTWLLFTWGVIDNGKIKLIRMNDETVEASYEAGGTNEQYQEKPKIALTFDDGPHPVYTPRLLDGLEKRGVVATFFVTGENAAQYPDIIKRMDKDGHLIGNHTYTHIQLTSANRDKFRSELGKTNETLKQITGKDVTFVRPPYGSWDKSFETELNMFPVLWNIDPLDWCSNNADCVVRKVESNAEENSIILLHDCYETSVKAALRIIDDLTAQGYHFVTVDEILFD